MGMSRDTAISLSQLGGSSYTADQGFFAYSSITEQKDNGTVSILYEDNQFGWGVGDDFGYTLAYKTYSQTELEEKLGIDFIDNSDPDVPGEDDGDENPDAIPVDLKIGETQTFTDTTGNYETFPGNVLPDAQIAGMTVKGEDGKQDVAADPSTTLTAGTYLIVNTRANKLVNNTSYSQSAGAGTMNGLSLNGLSQAMTLTGGQTDSVRLTIAGNDGTGLVKTADKITVEFVHGSHVVATANYTVIVVGDTNLDGVIQAGDAIVMMNIYNGVTYSTDGEAHFQLPSPGIRRKPGPSGWKWSTKSMKTSKEEKL